MIDYKGYTIYKDEQYPTYRVKRKGSGPAPKALRGIFTTQALAQEFIDSYIKTSGGKDGKTKGTSSG